MSRACARPTVRVGSKAFTESYILGEIVSDVIDRAGEALKPAASSRIHTFIATSPIHMKMKLRMEPEQVIEQADSAGMMLMLYLFVSIALLAVIALWKRVAASKPIEGETSAQYQS